MKTYKTIGWKHKVVFVAATFAISVGSLQLLAGAMTHPDPEALAARQQFIAAESVRADRIRALEQGEVQFAETTDRR